MEDLCVKRYKQSIPITNGIQVCSLIVGVWNWRSGKMLLIKGKYMILFQTVFSFAFRSHRNNNYTK